MEVQALTQVDTQVNRSTSASISKTTSRSIRTRLIFCLRVTINICICISISISECDYNNSVGSEGSIEINLYGLYKVYIGFIFH